ncbi:Ferredoxin-1 [Tetrabaena socialis]|uniref:Ferredoxin n=1 Tax=Tetrabaena socialis TaxID=47790 RepID=A0A2J8AE76_9CHLO|nr:Ferredoxin-1 [Tetrabaena socialis]|eukprot:PNH10812.1 Ferredoxin-1 [Tetrabaena socialis]
MTSIAASPCVSRTCRASAFGSRRVARTLVMRPMAARTMYKVEIEHQGKRIDLSVPEGESILLTALDQGMDLPHDCRLGVCMTCPAKLISGKVDQSGSMLSDDVAAKGYTLLCVATPKSDCKITTISEDELLDLQLCSGM